MSYSGTMEKSIYNLIKIQSEKSPDSIAILAPERKPLTYRQLLLQIDYVARKLNSMGLGRNDRIATVLPDGPEMAVTFISVASCATFVPMNPHYLAGEFSPYLSDLNAKSVIVQAGIETPVREVAKNLGIPVIELCPLPEEEAGIFTLTGQAYPDSKDSDFASPDDIALLLLTSGTTSMPKIVPLTQSIICTTARILSEGIKLDNNDRTLNISPLFHAQGLLGQLLSSLISGAGVVCTPGFFAPEFFEWMKEFSPTWYSASPHIHQLILERAGKNKKIIDEHPLRIIRTGAAPMPAGVLAELERIFNVPVIEVYGTTESYPVSSNPMPPGKRKINSAGTATETDIAIMDERGNFLTSGETGEILVKGPTVISGYENNPEANRKSFINGWFRTGDQGFIDLEGYLFITGRIKEIINRGGEKISPGEVEKVLIEHPSVSQAVTFSVPHEKLGEDLAAAVVLKDNTSVTEIELREFVASRLSYFKVPGQVVFINEIPKGTTGKVQRIGLAEKLGIKSNLEQIKEKTDFVPAETPLEKELEKIWCHVLCLEQIGINDNFLFIGGDSILATQIIALVRKKMQVELTSFDFFESPTIAEQAMIIEELILKEIENVPE
jgi:acyl-CoA synthetase (AMP-forming)/AMP-acid ligase II